jgi:integrase
VDAQHAAAQRAIALSTRQRRIVVREILMMARLSETPPALGSMPLTVVTAGSALAECGERCADPAHCAPAGTRFHDLRHFYASALIAENVNPKVIQERMGNATMAETMDTYGKAWVLNLLLLYAQRITNIVRLTTDHVHGSSGRCSS